MSFSMIARRGSPPPDYEAPSWPSLQANFNDPQHSLFYLRDIWRFTTIWTLTIYGLVHIGAAGIALFMHQGKRWSNWKHIWIVPVSYIFVAATEALMAGSVVGLMIGAVYIAGEFAMTTWIPFIWGWINVLVLIISSFSIQGGL